MDLKGEQWVRVKDFPLYEVSSHGRVRSYYRAGTVPRLLAMTTQAKGYFVARLYREGKRHYFQVHRLVAEHFLKPPIHKERFVRHKNRNKRDNRFKNLEWIRVLEIPSREEPTDDRRFVPHSSILRIKLRKNAGEDTAKVARAFGVLRSTVHRIMSNQIKEKHG